jgi:hypothetical protein
LDMPISEEQLEVLISETPLEVPKEEDIWKVKKSLEAALSLEQTEPG